MEFTESYRGSEIDVHTSVLASGRVSFVICIDRMVVNAEIGSTDAAATARGAMSRAKRSIDARRSLDPAAPVAHADAARNGTPGVAPIVVRNDSLKPVRARS